MAVTTAITAEDIGARVARRVAETVGPRKYAMWFDRSARFDVIDDNRVAVAVPNRFVADWIGKNFTQEILAAASDELGGAPGSVAVELRVEPERFAMEARTGTAASAAVASPAHALPKPALPRPTVDRAAGAHYPALRHDLDTFVVGPSNQLAFAATRRLIDDVGEPGSAASGAGGPLFLHGGCGLGKTHLLQGACTALLRRRPDARVHYTTGEQFTNEYITAVRSNKLDAFRKRIRSLDLLAVDDVHFIANKQATQQEFLHSFDQIELGGARVILASDCHPKLIRQFSEALISRCVRGLVVQVEKPDRETRLRLIAALADRRGMRLQDGVAAALADADGGAGAGGSVREIEGTLTKLLALASLGQEPRAFASHDTVVGHALVRQLLSADPMASRVRKPVRFEQIVKGVGEYLGVTTQQINGRSRHKQLVLARAMVVHLARRLTSMSYPEIAAGLGKGNHSTVITAAQRVEKMLVKDEAMLLTNCGGEPANIRPTELVAKLREVVAG